MIYYQTIVDIEEIHSNGCWAHRRRLCVRSILGWSPVEWPKSCVEGIETETAVLRYAVDPLAPGHEVRRKTHRSIHVSYVQDGRAKRHAVYHWTFHQLRDRHVRAHRRITRPLDHEGCRSSLSIVPMTQFTQHTTTNSKNIKIIILHYKIYLMFC